MQIVIFSDRFRPEGNALANRIYELSLEWVKLGHQVIVVTTFPNYPYGKVYAGYNRRLSLFEDMDGIKVLRVWSFFSQKSTLSKVLLHSSFSFFAILLAIMRLKKPDVVIGTFPWPSNAFAAHIFSKIKRCPFVIEVRDLWPETTLAVNALKKSFIFKCLESIVNIWYKEAKLIVPVTEGFAKAIRAKDFIDGNKTVVIKNGVNISETKPSSLDHYNIKRRYGIGSSTTLIVFIGTLGVAQGLDIIPRIAGLMQHDDVHFIIMGEGSERESLESTIKQNHLNNITLLPGQQRAIALELLTVADMSLITLKASSFFETTIPSKLFEAMALAKPILLGIAGESAEIVGQAQCGLVFKPGDASAAVAQIHKFNKLTSAERNTIGQNGYNFVKSNYNRHDLAKLYLSYLQNICT